MKRLLLYSLFATAAFGQTTVNLGTLTVSADAVSAFQLYMQSQVNTAVAPTSLASDITAGATSTTLASTSQITPTVAILVEAEAMIITAKNGGTGVTITRGAFGTTPAAHSAGVTVQILKYATVQVLVKAILQDAVATIMQTYSPGIKTQIANVQAASSTADVNIAALKAGAIQ